MISNYSLYYSYKNIGDVLIVDLDNDAVVTSHQQIDNIVVIYSHDQVVGYNIFNFSKIVKIKTQGLIYLPSNILIDVINDILNNAHLENLAYKSNSGYLICEIKQIDELDGVRLIYADARSQMLLCLSKKEGLEVGQKVVLAISGTTLNNGVLIRDNSTEYGLINGHICTNKELNISNDNQIFLVDEEGMIGNDFFQIGEHDYERN